MDSLFLLQFACFIFMLVNAFFVALAMPIAIFSTTLLYIVGPAVLLALLFFNLTFIALGSSYVPTEELLDKEEENKGSSRTRYMRSGGGSSGSCQKSKIISAECGFSCRTHLYRIFKTKEGCSPTEWRAFHSTDAAQKGSNWAYPFFVKTPKKKQKFYRKIAKRVSHSYECDTLLVWMRHLNSEKPHLLSCQCPIFATWRK